MITLYPYQQQIIDNCRKFFTSGGTSAVVTAPTGAGKTVMFSYICQQSTSRGKKVLILTERAELLLQTGGTLKNFSLNPFYIQAGIKYINYNHNTYVAMAQTLSNRIDKKIWRDWLAKIDLVIIDECHKQNFNYLFENGLLEGKKVLGFTATPKRTGKMRQLALDYEKIIESVTVSELIELGYLVSDDYSGIKGVNTNEIKYNTLKGDFDERDMFTKFNAPKLYAGVVKNWEKICPNTQTLVFCVNIEHAIKTTLEFRSIGVDARFIVSPVSTPKEPSEGSTPGQIVLYQDRLRVYQLYKKYFSMYSGERRSIFDRFKRKGFPVLINAGIATTGYDNPALETIIVNRATTSQTLWLQMIGRGSRISPGKTHFNLLDFGENAGRLGHYTAPQLWHLWHESKQGTGLPPLKECGIASSGRPVYKDKEGCERLILASLKICPFCGFKYPKKKIAKEVDLEQLMYNGSKSVIVKKIGDMDDEELYKYFKSKRHKSPWLWRQLFFRGGEKKIRDFGKELNWTKATIENAVNYNKVS